MDVNSRFIRLSSSVLALALLVPLSVALDQPRPANASVAVATPGSSNSTVTEFTVIGSGLSISGFSSNIRVVISTSAASGELKLTTTSGLTAVAGYSNSSSLTTPGDDIAFEGSQSDANTALAGLQYKGASAGSDTISIEVLDAGISPVNLSGVYHYYGLSTGATTYTYANAKSDAATSRTINGTSVTPWLATVGSSAENLAISSYVNANAWIGGEVTGTSGSTRTWSWVTSNSADGLSGVSFATDEWNPSCPGPRGGTATENGYQNWYDYRDATLNIDTTGLQFTEPNNCSGGATVENRLIMYSERKNVDGSTWNDVGVNGPFKYIWEYASVTPLSLNASFSTSVTDPSTPPQSSGGSPSVTYHSVLFDANGGTGETQTVSNYTATALPAHSLVRPGFVFTSWNTKADGTGIAYADRAIYSFDADVSLYAQWIPAKGAAKVKKYIGTFAGDKPTLTKKMRSTIARWANKLPQNAAITCRGSTSGIKATLFHKRLASNRAKNVCEEAVKRREDLTYSIKLNPASATKVSARHVWIIQN